MFNTYTCANGCRPRAARVPFPDFWSRYATPPKFITLTGHLQAEDLVKLADCVVLFDRLGAVWNGTAHIKGDEVVVVASRVWSSTVGRTFTVKGADAASLLTHSEVAPEGLQKRFGREHMACLVRS